MSDAPQHLGVRLTVTGHHVRMRSDLRKLDPCIVPGVIVALASHLGYDVKPLHKASDDIDVDPRYPWLRTLIRAARDNWQTYGRILVQRVTELVQRGDMTPMTATSEAALRRLFADHHVSVVATFAGHHPDRRAVSDLQQRGELPDDVSTRALVPVAYRMGRQLPALDVHPVPSDASPTLATVVRRALQRPLTPRDEAAIDYARTHAAVYMRRPAEVVGHQVERVLTEATRAPIGEAVAAAVQTGESWRRVAADLAAVADMTGLASDMDRVARTELHAAHAFGAYTTLKESATRAGEPDPWVYKIVRARACVDCKRIWGEPANPRRYRLSTIEAREAAGGNMGLSHLDWGPVIGPVHPNCTEGALLYWRADLVDAVQEALADLSEWFGG